LSAAYGEETLSLKISAALNVPFLLAERYFDMASCWRGFLNNADVKGLRAFLSVFNVKLYFLSIGERLEAVTSDSSEMYKYVITIFTLDKPEALFFVKPFYTASLFCHLTIPPGISILFPTAVSANSIKVLEGGEDAYVRTRRKKSKLHIHK
jgi:hypothetical protein